MQILSELLQYALAHHVLEPADLYTTEPEVIAKLNRHPHTASAWESYCSLPNDSGRRARFLGRMAPDLREKTLYRS